MNRKHYLLFVFIVFFSDLQATLSESDTYFKVAEELTQWLIAQLQQEEGLTIAQKEEAHKALISEQSLTALAQAMQKLNINTLEDALSR